MAQRTNHVWRLASRPSGEIDEKNFTWSEEPVPELKEGELLVRNIYLSLDPTNRIWMSDMDQYMPPVQIGEVMRGGTVGVVEESRHPDYAPGDLVSGLLGWQLYAVSSGQGIVKLPTHVPVPLTAFMAVLNHIGATAYFGLLELGKPKEGETVVVSAAAGAVGSLVGQLAKIKGCRTIGLAGSDEKCRWLTEELGFDGAINYKIENVAARLKELCPKGIDVYFDNVGGEILDTVLTQMNLFGRIPLCGLISQYNSTSPQPGPTNFTTILMRRLRIEGFIVLDYADRYPEAFTLLGQWIGSGALKYRVDMAEGLKNAPQTLQRLFTGENIGKQVLKISDEPSRETNLPS